MNFSEIFKKSFLEGFTATDINIYTAALALVITSFIALYIFVVYRVMTRKAFYSKSFNISLAAIAVITAAIIITIQSSIVVSLGMVGALSIVRFRTAIKDPMDLVFLFWSIAVGIICGVGLSEIAVMLSLIITVGIIVLDKLPVAKAPQVLVVNSGNTEIETLLLSAVDKHAKYSSVKSRNMTQNSLDMVIELRTDAGSELLKEVLGIEGVASASLLAHDGEVTF
ncbi:MAG: DUF4956 domain-containing protein [Lachnospiraceae bacterium]|nr:DUF4956 domain-containing protein [Lachnospiraceae bacterium]